jgi:hypothetical protein
MTDVKIIALGDADPGQIASELDVPAEILGLVVSEPKRRYPQSELRIIRGPSGSHVVINFPKGDFIDLERRPGFITIGAGGGFDRYFLVIVIESITDAEAVGDLVRRISKTQFVPRADLRQFLSVQLVPLYQRIRALQQDGSR